MMVALVVRVTTTRLLLMMMQMRHMFYRATAFNAAVGGWDTSKVNQMNSVFEHAQAFNQTGIAGWDIGKVTERAGRPEKMRTPANLPLRLKSKSCLTVPQQVCWLLSRGLAS